MKKTIVALLVLVLVLVFAGCDMRNTVLDVQGGGQPVGQRAEDTAGQCELL